MNQPLEIIPLGGMGEFGMNCTVLRYQDDLVLLDAGVAFPGGRLGGLGIDLIVPDFRFLKDNREKFRAVLLTHGHEDHAGAVSYLIDELPVPIYGSRLTLGLVAQRLRERKLLASAELLPLEARRKLQIGPFQIEPLHLTHSFPDSFAFAIQTPVGQLIWTGDFKFDQTPIDGNGSDLARLAHYGEEGVLALFSDSTNSDRPGLAPSEYSVIDPLRNLFRQATKKIVISCFASSIHRIQIVLDLAREFGRKVCPIGRSMVSNIRVSRELGYLDRSAELLISPGQARELAPEQVVVLAAGSQGEPMSALSRLAVNEFRKLKLESGDLVVLSARLIPGNEKLIGNVVNHLYRRGARVVDARQADVHASGHGYRADLKLMLNLTRPRYFIPIHGEYRQLSHHADLAREQQIPDENIWLLESGDLFCLGRESAEIGGAVSVGRRFIDDGRREEVDEVVVRDRRFLSEDGFLIVVLQMDRFSGDLIGQPELVSRGLVHTEGVDRLMSGTRDQILATLKAMTPEERKDEDLLQEILSKDIKKFLRKRTGKRPVIMPVTLEM